MRHKKLLYGKVLHMKDVLLAWKKWFMEHQEEFFNARQVKASAIVPVGNRDALEACPIDSAGWLERGKSLFSLSQYDGALAAFEAGLKLDHADVLLQLCRDEALYRLGRYDEIFASQAANNSRTDLERELFRKKLWKRIREKCASEPGMQKRAAGGSVDDEEKPGPKDW